MKSEVVRLQSTTVGRLRQALEQLDLPTRRFPIVYDANQGTAVVSGPSRYVDLVLQTARAVDQVQPNAPSSMSVRVFPLQYAWAADFVYTQSGRDQVIPGMATVLSQLHGAVGAPSRVSAGKSRTRSPLDALRGLGAFGSTSAPGGLSGLDNGARGNTEDSALQSLQTRTPAGGADGPQFVADGRLNAVIVRDRPEQMSSHEATIRALDVKPGLVEIEVRIIEVNTDALESLGIDWRLRTGKIDFQSGNGNQPGLDFGSALSSGKPLAGPSGSQSVLPPTAGVFTTVLGDAGRFLIMRVNALAQDGRANLLSSPKVLTLDNVEAVLENLNTFFVRVAGNLDASLYDVSVGTSMRVTPLIVKDGDGQQVKLAIRIEDGALTGNTVDNIPIVRRSAITTQSLIDNGQALLIAGYAQESDTNDNSGVPGLSSLPYVGNLFKHTEKRKTRVERFYLLTPRVVAL